MDSRKRFDILRAVVCCALPVVFAGCHQTFGPQLQGSGIAKTETREVGSFSEIEVAGGIELNVSVGPATSLTVTADDNIVPLVNTQVSGEQLRIHVDAGYSSQLGVKVDVSVPTLSALEASGACHAVIEGVSGSEFQLKLSGASQCQFAGNADVIRAELNGASRSALTGTAQQLEIECSGASQVDAKEMKVEAVSAELSGASTAHVNAAESLTATASGASTLRYVGQPSELEMNASGASTIATE